MRLRASIPALALALSAALPGAASDQDRETKGLPGFIDGSAFVELAGEDSSLVEIHLGPSMLRTLSGLAEDDKEAGEVFRQLKSIQAYIVEIEDDPSRFSRAEALIKRIEGQLQREGWEHIARVREKGERVGVFVLNGKTTVEGLTVLVCDSSENQVVFVNIVGSIDLAKISEIGDQLNVPGLDAVEERRGAEREEQ